MGLLYLTSTFPKRSETFVYREVLGLRKLGVDIVTASLHEPEVLTGDSELEALAKETRTLYPAGMGSLLSDAAAFVLHHPVAALRVLVMAAKDFFSASDIGLKGRSKVLIQALAAMALAQRLRFQSLSGIHVHMAHAPATVGMYLSVALGIPWSFTGHAVDLFRDRCLLKEKLQRASFVACISEWHRQWYEQISPGDHHHYPVIRCGVDVPDEPVASRESGVLQLLGLARLVPKKGFDTMLRAVGIMRQKGIPVECALAGDGPERERLQKLAHRLDLENNVRFLGAVSHAKVAELLRDADVMVLPCKVDEEGDRDGIPVALMEAMACGMPVISGDLPTIRELIEDGVSGLLVSPGDEEALAQAICKLASNTSLRNQLGSAGRTRVKEEFETLRNLQRLLNSLTEHHML
jgi:glycosyltransferase involved in cell wall biosynthesis